MDEAKSTPFFSKNDFKAWAWHKYNSDPNFVEADRIQALNICNEEWDLSARENALEFMNSFDDFQNDYFQSKVFIDTIHDFEQTMRKREGARLFWDYGDIVGAEHRFDSINDGGERISYGEGKAMREPADGKGRFDLITPFGMRRLARWYELGANKYADRNWEKGIPFSRYLDSAMRHLNKFLMGMDDEDHLSAAAWNILAIIHHQELGQWELDDLPHYKGVGFGAGAPLPEGFEGHWKKHIEALEAKCDEVNKKAEAAMKAQLETQIEDLKARIAAMDQGEESRNKLINVLKDAAPKSLDETIKQGPTYPACLAGGSM